MKTLTDHFHIVEAIAPRAGNAAVVGDYVSMKNCNHLSVLASLVQTSAEPIVVEILQAKDVAGTDAKALAQNVEIRVNEDTAASDALSATADGVSYQTGATIKNKIVVFDLLPEDLDVNGGFDCIAVKISSTEATDLIASSYIVSGLRYHGQSMIVD